MRRTRFIARDDGFICDHCRKNVNPAGSGNSYRNHCPYCLWSKHVDVEVPGDRKSECGGMMKPVAVTKKHNEYVITHRCEKCGYERPNRVANDDNFVLLVSLSTTPLK